MFGIPVRNDSSLTIVSNWADFCSWAREGGYDESYLDVNDSKCMALQEQYIEEMRDVDPEERRMPA